MRLAETYRASRRNEAKGRMWRGIPARAPRPLMGGAARRAAKRDTKQSGYAAAGLNSPAAMARRARQSGFPYIAAAIGRAFGVGRALAVSS